MSMDQVFDTYINVECTYWHGRRGQAEMTAGVSVSGPGGP